jgi:hypothetical protein
MSKGDAQQKPQITLPTASQLPAELLPLKRWCGFKLVWDDSKKKWRKPPASPVDGTGIAPTAKYEADFVTATEALAGITKHHLDGLGFEFAEGDGYVGIDFDNAIQDGIVKPAVENWLPWFPTFAEISVSRKGIHVIGRGKIKKALTATELPDGNGATVEIYAWDRYFTVTGLNANNIFTIEDVQVGLDKLLAHLGASNTSGPSSSTDHPKYGPMTVAAARKLHADNVTALREAKEGEGNARLNQCCFFVGRAFAAGALEGTKESLQAEILNIVLKEWDSPHPEQGARQTFDSGWDSGTADPISIINPIGDLDSWLRGEVELTSESVCERAALLSEIEFADRRLNIIKKLRWKPTLLDKEVYRRRPKTNEEEEELQGTAVVIADVDPWPEPVDGAALLDELASSVKKYVYFHHATDAEAAALWILGTYCFDLFDLFPFLGISAPDESSGKTTLLKWANRLVCRPITTGNITPAALFRLIEKYKGTVLIDEMDTFLNPDSELYGILNSGHEKEMAHATRTVGENHDPRRFTTWCPRAYAMIGLPKRTLLSRSLAIRLLRKSKDVDLVPLPKLRRMGPEWERLRSQCARWVSDNSKALQESNVDVSDLANRAADNWEPLFAIASLAGESWLQKARKSAGLSAFISEEGLNTILLRDIRNIFHTRDKDKIPCKILTLDLSEQIESPWPHYDHNQPLNTNQLGILLSKLGIASSQFKEKGKNVRGFSKDDFKALFESYCQGEAEEVKTYDVKF